MRDRGDVLELLHTSPDRWESLRLAGNDWRHVKRSHEAWEQWVADMRQGQGPGSVGGFMTITAQAEGVQPDELVVNWRQWRAKPDKIRTEFKVGSETVRAILIGPEWWSWSPSAGIRTNGGDPRSAHGVGPAEVLVDTPRLLSFLRLRAVTRTTYLSRSAYEVSAEPNPLDRNLPTSVLHALGPGADRYALVVDAEIGILLKAEAQRDGEPFRLIEVEELGFNEQSDESLFSPDALAG